MRTFELDYLFKTSSELGVGGVTNLQTLHFDLRDLWAVLDCPLAEMIRTNVERFKPQEMVSITLAMSGERDKDKVEEFERRLLKLFKDVDTTLRMEGDGVVDGKPFEDPHSPAQVTFTWKLKGNRF